jgi:hypothetical protein
MTAGTHAQASLDGTCIPKQLLVGGPTEVSVRIKNTGGTAWPTAVAQIDGLGAFVIDNIAGGSGAKDDGSGFYELGPLAAGDSTSLDLSLHAKTAGNDTVTIAAWGAQPASDGGLPNAPDNVKTVSCDFVIDP